MWRGASVNLCGMSPQLRAVVRRQAGCFTRQQALRCGSTAADVARHLLDGEWLAVMGDVLIVAGAPVSEAMKAWTGVLAIGQPVALASLSAGRWTGLEQVPEPPRPQFVVPNDRRPRDTAGLDLHRVVPARWQVDWRRGLPVTPPALTIRDMAAELGAEQLRDVVQHALRRRRTSFEALTATLGRGRPGSTNLRAVLDEVAPGFQVKWERLLHRACLRAGVRMQPQTLVEAPDGRRAYVDLGIEQLRFGVEIDGFLNHMARFAADRRRARLLALELGWTIAPYAVEEIAAGVERVAAEIARHVRRLRAGLAA
jgi:very-short-patch-repair endonuclease